jgi:hypothetical protein
MSRERRAYLIRYLRDLRKECKRLRLCGRCHKQDVTPGTKQCEMCRTKNRGWRNRVSRPT